MGGHDCFDVVAGGEVGFDAGTHGGGEGAGHGCCWLGGDSRRGESWKGMLVFEIMASGSLMAALRVELGMKMNSVVLHILSVCRNF